MPSNSSDGRRAAQATAAPMDNDQEERNASLRKVQARDLVEFGMIPVSKLLNTCKESNAKKFNFRNLLADFPFSYLSIVWMLAC